MPHATDRAVLEAATQLSETDDGEWRLRAELPFETNRGYAAALGDTDGRRGGLLAVKGAPEVVLPLCDAVIRPNGGTGALTEAERRTPCSGRCERLAADGLRVLAVAERRDRLPRRATELD